MTNSLHESAPMPNSDTVEYVYTLEYARTLPVPVDRDRILIIENHPAIADMLCWTLELAGFHATVVERVEASLESILQSSDPLVLVLLDLSVSLVDAQSFMETLHEHWNIPVPIVILTTNKELQSAFPAYRVILKPFHIHDLLAAIQEVLLS
jgi:DNA-binding response OmpR family regulator